MQPLLVVARPLHAFTPLTNAAAEVTKSKMIYQGLKLVGREFVFVSQTCSEKEDLPQRVGEP